ncbi:hypothetical protein [Parasitella parasitica]|uniref:BHLH domain-containing protein n=1 Tax=Parasitella parasitica TaxID=35722 RepID=A0A0B7MUK1_9FUNG|nr:hypothetical protein [Parasitella parasitica]
MSQQQQQPLSLRNPTSYHLSTLNNNNNSSNHITPQHPLADIEMQHHHQILRDSPISDQQRNSIDFDDTFSQHVLHPMSAASPSDPDDHMEYQQHSGLYDRSSFGSATMGNISMDHRRSSAATDISLQHGYHNQQPMFIPGSSLDSTSHSLAMSAPANMYDYSSFHVAAGHQQHQIDSLENGASGTSASNSLARSFEDDYQMQMKPFFSMQVMMEKRRRRRESHNAVERRRRDNINDRIQELFSLLPENALEGSNYGPNNKPNKGAILRKSVDHIRHLQHELSTHLLKVEELEHTLKMYQQQQQQGGVDAL